MQNLKALSDTELHDKTHVTVKEERRITAKVLALLRENESRRLYLQMRYSSLFEYCTKDLGYSESAAQRRIDAMRLTRELPQIESKIIEGRLNLSTVLQAQKF